jgi:hypothetical protein
VFINPSEVPVQDIWVGNEEWQAPDISDLRNHMRRVYSDDKLRKDLGSNGIDRAYKYSFQGVGQRMKNLLTGVSFTDHDKVRADEFNAAHSIRNLARKE